MSIIAVWASSFKMEGDYTILAGIGILLDTRGSCTGHESTAGLMFFLDRTVCLHLRISYNSLGSQDTLYQRRLWKDRTGYRLVRSGEHERLRIGKLNSGARHMFEEKVRRIKWAGHKID